ncbi:MAG: hypothetical protein K9W46_05095 [Candidatus Heimdallarchaeum endolithica]|uniref:Uncharacterized protein n=1 Tax=Candidatus Heimdallarchaeum endolithica TaxID=2876572 RepID=A0A9Y1BTB5_9ARCH|nr:MAG: hypothetical protein K9W46_05095 [Candidatus Heimdallarchaeum endolithica]
MTKRDDKYGYKIWLANIPEELKENSIIFLPELSSKQKKHIKYVSKFTMQNTGDVVVKLVRSDGVDPFGRPKALAQNIIVSSEEYNFNSLLYYASPLIYSELFNTIKQEPQILPENVFRKEKNKIHEKIDDKTLREIVVSAMIQEKVILQPNLSEEGLIELAALVDKAIPYEASYDFSLISYSDKTCQNQLVHNVLYFFGKYEKKKEEKVIVKNKQSKVEKIAKEEKYFLNYYIDLILNENYETLLEEQAKFVIGMYHNEHRELQKLFTKRYQLNIPFNKRTKFQAKLMKAMSKRYN